MQRAGLEDAFLGHPSQILRMGTSNGAKALGIDAGMLVVGKKADVISLDLKKDMMFTPLLKKPKKTEGACWRAILCLVVMVRQSIQ
jgi:5-methylthioadenosine/S-adenosylhomocysteine deaminase